MSKHCCNEMASFIETEELSIQYYPKYREYGIAYIDGGTSFQEIKYCPWCRSVLPDSLRDKWFSVIESMGYEPGDTRIPRKYLSDEWWQSEKNNRK